MPLPSLNAALNLCTDFGSLIDTPSFDFLSNTRDICQNLIKRDFVHSRSRNILRSTSSNIYNVSMYSQITCLKVNKIYDMQALTDI